MARKKQALVKSKTSLAKQTAALKRARKEVLARGAKLRRPHGLSRRKVLVMTASILLAIIVAFTATVGFLIYKSHSDSALVYRVSRIVPFPVARVNGDFVAYADYLFEVRYRKNIYSNPSGPASGSQEPVDFSKPESQQLLNDIQLSSLERAKIKAIIKQIAKDNNVTVSAQELDQAVDELVQSQGGEKKFLDAIERFYGWNMNDFRQEYQIQLLQQKLQLAVLPVLSTEQKTQAEAILARARGGEDFAALAREFSQDPGSKDQGGDLDFIAADTPFVPEFKEAALKLEPGQVSDVVASQFGFHIIKAFEKNSAGEVKVSHVLIQYAQDMDTVVSEELAKAKVSDYIKLPQPQQ
ncbi:peptidylprolyl isomerase [Candidatus Microgenomates bacterium]|nr:peptidylprolyl isomerase [Candidatus Microgenomates bacterium]